MAVTFPTNERSPEIPRHFPEKKLRWRSHRGIARRLARLFTPEYQGLQHCGTLRPLEDHEPPEGAPPAALGARGGAPAGGPCAPRGTPPTGHTGGAMSVRVEAYLAQGEDYTGVQVRLTTDRRGEAHAYYHGLRYCGSPHVCPICAERLASARTDEIGSAAGEWVASGGRLVLGTFTLRHHRGESFEGVRDRLGKAWRRMVSSRAWKEKVHYAAYVRSLEVTWGLHGWHPHLHILFFFWDEVPVAEDIFPLWENAVSAVGGEAVPEAFSWEEVNPTDVVEVGRYVCKWGAVQEVGGGVWKEGGAGLSPWEILLLAGYRAGLIRYELCGHAVQHAKNLGVDLEGVDWVKLWQEYARGVKGLRSVGWSRGARELFRVFTDEEHLHREPEDSVVVGTLTVADYLRLWWAGLDQDFLAVVETCGWDAALVVLSLAPPLPDG